MGVLVNTNNNIFKLWNMHRKIDSCVRLFQEENKKMKELEITRSVQNKQTVTTMILPRHFLSLSNNLCGKKLPKILGLWPAQNVWSCPNKFYKNFIVQTPPIVIFWRSDTVLLLLRLRVHYLRSFLTH